ncbi:MAG TPA: alanyl-tRNA editing protein [Gammaproteobacteria bacterium]|nr:alanyl-tRNA editing protein [Gammaproteobacteria bacterium]
MTLELFRDDGYLRACKATVTSVEGRNICTDQTVFYPAGGGQPGDWGTMKWQGACVQVMDTTKDRTSNNILHLLAENSVLPVVGTPVQLEIDWARRHRLMRMHSLLHMLCVAIPAPVTGGSVRDGSGRLDFDLPEPPDRVAIEMRINDLIEQNAPMQLHWISDEEMAERPELVRTMSVQPPIGMGKVRLVEFVGVDLQPCGGTHVAATGEIGPVKIHSIKKKGKQNRRITVVFANS